MLFEVARFDLATAMDLAQANGIDYSPPPQSLVKLSPAELSAVADRLVNSGQPPGRALNGLMQSWPRVDPAGHWAWLVRHGAAVDPNLINAAAAAFASFGVEPAPQAVYELPAEVRQAWIVEFAHRYARSEPDAAVAWLRGLQSDPEYDTWAADVASALLVRSTPGINNFFPGRAVLVGPAAEILATMRNPPTDIIASAASFWARTSPMEVAQWALRLPNSEARTSAVVAGVGGWTVRDLDGSRQWALGLPEGVMRDRALVAHMAQAIASHGTVSQRVVDEIGTRAEFEAAITANRGAFTMAFRVLGSRDPDAARALLGRYVGDEGLRAEFSAAIDAVLEAVRTTDFTFPRELVLSTGP
jgi:hypothetical protein